MLDLYVYKLGINGGRVPLATVEGMFKSVVSVVLLFGANKISKAGILSLVGLSLDRK